MSGKRILLLYITEISGHHSATIAVEKALTMVSPETEILNMNAFNYTNPISEKIINRLYLNVIQKAPQVWDYLYDNPSVVKKLQSIKQTIHKLNSPKLKVLFDEFKPDVIACSQAFPCGMVADFKKLHHSALPLVAILTDYVPHAYWIYDSVDYYVAPDHDVALRLMKKGVNKEKIKALGIPINPEFNTHAPRHDIMRSLGLDDTSFTILIMGGGQGLGPITKIIESLQRLTVPAQEIVVTGTNKKLYDALKSKRSSLGRNIVLFEYARNVNELMSISDIIITKPGGITTAEALTNHLPMIIVEPIPGQEENNAQFLTQKGAAIQVDNPSDVNLIIEGLRKDPERLTTMRECAASVSKPNASRDIAKLLLSL